MKNRTAKAVIIALAKRARLRLGARVRLLALLAETSALLTMLVCEPKIMWFLRSISREIVICVFAMLAGLLVSLSASRLGARAHVEVATEIDEFTGALLVRRKLLQTFLGIFIWNLFLSSLVVLAGFATMGVVPVVWAFLNLGLLLPTLDYLKYYVHCWFETSAVLISTSLGVWGGLNLNLVLAGRSIPTAVILFIIALYAFAASLEAMEGVKD